MRLEDKTLVVVLNKLQRLIFRHIELTLILNHSRLQLEKRLEEEKQERIRKEQEMATKQNGLSILSNGNDDFRPRILQRPKPAVTILKRPDSSPALSSTSQQNSKPQMKTLEQREKEYAEARLRILGSSAASDESPTEQR